MRQPRASRGIWAAASLAALILGIFVYRPALHGPFLFDDLGLPFGLDSRANPLSDWISGVRPVLMFSYWLNHSLWGDGQFSYHLVNVLIHVANSALVFLLLSRLLAMTRWSGRARQFASAAGALVFLLHPLQTESVSYVAGRSESLMAFFLLAAYAIFLYRRREAISWLEALAVLVLFAIAVKTKENAVSFAGILVLTDLFGGACFNPPGSGERLGLSALRKNWRLYILMLPGAVIGAVSVFRMLAQASSAGFSLRAFTWYQYAFTEARAIFVYIRMALLPLGQSIDHDFAISRTIADHGAVFWIALLASLTGIAIPLRRRYPLSAFGFLMFLFWLAPTSSIVPVNDALVERRMYLALLGLILIGCEMGGRLPLRPAARYTAVVSLLVVFGGLSYARNRLYGAPEKLFEEAARASTLNSRPYASLADVAIAGNNCAMAVPYLERAGHLFPRDYMIELSWGRILECMGRREEALRRLSRAAEISPTSKVYELIGLLYGEMGLPDQASLALHQAVELDPRSSTAHKALALWYESADRLADAEREYQVSLSVNPYDTDARLKLARVRASLAQAQSPGSGAAR